MPNTKSAKKRHRQSLERRARNRAGRSELKTLIKKVRTSITEGDLEGAQSSFRVAQKALDQAAAGRLIHGNAAARVKSRLSAAIVAAKGAKQ